MGADQGFDKTSKSPGTFGCMNANCVVDNVEKVIWGNVPGTTAVIIVREAGFTKLNSEQSFAVAWDISAL